MQAARALWTGRRRLMARYWYKKAKEKPFPYMGKAFLTYRSAAEAKPHVFSNTHHIIRGGDEFGFAGDIF